MTVARTALVFAVFVAVAGLPSPRAEAAEAGEARAFLDRATTAAALAHYDVAAENFEKAFELKPDPEVLYKAAEAHDLAGNKPRALALYRSFLRSTDGRAGAPDRGPSRRSGGPPPAGPRTRLRPHRLTGRRRRSAGMPTWAARPSSLRAERQERVHRRVKWLVASIVVAGAGTAAAIGFGILELKAESDYNNVPLNDPNHQARLDALAQTGRRYSLYTNIGEVVTVVGLAGVGASVLSLVLLPRERRTAVALTPAIGPGLLGGVATLRF